MSELGIRELFDLTGQAAIVTGGAAGIGEAVARRLAEAGAHVLVGDLDSDGAARTVEAITSRGGSAAACVADIGAPGVAAGLVEAAMKAFGRVDVLVNNAAIYPPAPALELTEQAWDRTLDLNLKALFFLSQAAARQMVLGGRGGRIVNIASKDAVHPAGNLAHYDASKAGVIMLTKSLALELAAHDIRVNSVMPGAVETPGATRLIRNGTSAAGAPSPPRGATRIPLRRVGKPDDIARAVLFLSTTASDYMTGTSILVDGGFLIS